MRFWDSSALVPLVVQEDSTPAMKALYAEAPDLVVWWATDVEITSAVARLERSGELDLAGVTHALERMARLAERWQEINPTQAVRASARRLLRVHDLRAADSFQLAAALLLADGEPGALDFVCLDRRLATAAAREGLRVLPAPH